MPVNIFDIKTPQIYRCNVFRYNSGLSRLYIRVFKGASESPNFYLFFADVGYFEGPMNWKGANFQKASADECLELMVNVGMVEDIMLDDADTRAALSEAAHLYQVPTAYTTIRIIAGQAVRMDDVPDDIK